MSGFRHDHDTGERVYTEDTPAPELEPAPSIGPPMMPRANWVDGFLGGANERMPFSLPPRNRRAPRKSRRRV